MQQFEIADHDKRKDMSSEVRPATSGNGFLAPLRVAGIIAVVVGAAGSIGLTLRAGHRNNSLVLLMLFGVWVLSPFVALAVAYMISRDWPVLTRATLYTLTLVLTLGPLAIYGDVELGPPRAKPAFVFLVVPLASWLLIAIVLPAAAFLSGRLSRRRNPL